MEESVQPTPRGELPRREVMQTPEEVAAMLRLKALGWGVRRIAGELGCSHMTIRRYVAAGGWVAYRGRGRPRTLAGHEAWVAERFRRHAGNADVVRQELEAEKGIRLTLRTIEREVAQTAVPMTAAWPVTASNMANQTPCRLQRLKRLYIVVCGPYSAGQSRQRAPERSMCSIPLITRRSSTRCGPRGSGGSSRAHSASLRQYSCLAIHASTV